MPAPLRIPELRDEYCGDVDLVVELCFPGNAGGESMLGLEPDEILGTCTVKRADGPRGLPQPLGIRAADRALWDALHAAYLGKHRFRAVRA